MKKIAVLLLIAGLWGCLASKIDEDLLRQKEETFVNVPADFNWSPILQGMVQVDIESGNNKTDALDNTLIELYNEEGEFLDALTIIDGSAQFNLRIPSASEKLKLVTPATETVREITPDQTNVAFEVPNISAYQFAKTDIDEDGLYDQFDADPNDPNLTIDVGNNLLKSASVIKPSTSNYVIFEDLWPSKGDYDFNDLVVKSTFSWERGKGNYIEEISGVCDVEWIGAGMDLGLGFELFEAKGTNLNYVKDIIKGIENASEDENVTNGFVVFNKVQDGGTGEIEFNLKLQNRQIKDFVCIPYLFRTGEKSHQVRPFGAPPTKSQEMSMFRTLNDASPTEWSWEEGKRFKYPLSGEDAFYRSPENHPWGIEFMAKSFRPVKEKTSILKGYPKFTEWAESGGKKEKDWYNHPK